MKFFRHHCIFPRLATLAAGVWVACVPGGFARAAISLGNATANPALVAPPSAGPGAGRRARGPAAGNEPDIHDIHGPIPLTFFEEHEWQLIGGVAALAAAVWLAAWLISRRPPPRVLTPIERARQEVEAASALLGTGQDKAFAVQVSAAVRRYLEDAWQMPAPERTTEEFLVEAARQALLQGDLTPLLRRFLELCDLAKFAGREFGQAEGEDLLATASEFLEAAENILHPPAKSAAAEDEDEAPPPLPGRAARERALAKAAAKK